MVSAATCLNPRPFCVGATDSPLKWAWRRPLCTIQVLNFQAEQDTERFHAPNAPQVCESPFFTSSIALNLATACWSWPLVDIYGFWQFLPRLVGCTYSEEKIFIDHETEFSHCSPIVNLNTDVLITFYSAYRRTGHLWVYFSPSYGTVSQVSVPNESNLWNPSYTMSLMTFLWCSQTRFKR